MSDNECTSSKCDSRFNIGEFAKAVCVVVAIAAVAWLTIELTSLLLLIFAAVTIAAVFDTLAAFVVAKTGIGRGFALTAAVLLVLTIFVGAFVMFGAQMVREFDTVRATLPSALSSFEGFLDRYGLGDRARDLIASGASDASKLVSRAGGYAIAAGSGLADFVLVLVAAIFLASNPGVYRRGLLMLLPVKAEAPADAALDDARHGLSGWMLGQSISSIVVGVLTWVGLMILGVPASGGLAIIAGLLDVIPMVGPVIAGVPAVLLAFTVSPTAALWTVGLFLVIQQLQGNFLQPMIQKHSVDVPPALLLFAVFAFGLLFGFLGVVLAAPLTVVVFVVVRRLYVNTILGKALDEKDA